MKIINLIGGLGNQMFQYAFALSLKYLFPNEKIKIDISAFNGYSLHNGLEIFRIFPKILEVATLSDIIKLNYPIWNYRSWQIRKHILPKLPRVILENKSMEFNPLYISEIGDYYYDGYWQAYRYFEQARNFIIDSLTFPDIMDKFNLKLLNIIQNYNCVSIHVRRGDYINHPLYKGICTLDYYKQAILHIKELAPVDKFIIFSNDHNWTYKYLNELFGNTESVYVDWNKGMQSFRDIQLMSQCKHNIIANSSFSWWGAWLNQNQSKIIIAPNIWTNSDICPDIIPENWIKLPIS